MGITIHYRFGIQDEKTLEKLLTKIKEIVEEEMEIIHFELSDEKKSLIILPHPNCETLELEFEKWEDIKKRYENSKEWNYVYETLKDEFSEETLEDLWVCSSFCKTQFAGDITHAKVCEILRIMASFCSLVKIDDEGEYYETRDKENLLECFGENARLIRAMSEMFKKAGFEEVITGFDEQELNTT